MTPTRIIPIFPLNILPLPNELVPLHIFEPRYRQLLDDLERDDNEFGVYFVHDHNTDRIGSLMRLESILKRYDTGESDIVVKCVDTFLMTKYYKNYKTKLYAGGEIFPLKTNNTKFIGEELKDNFEAYLIATKSKIDVETCNIHDIANVLELDNMDRLKYVKLLSNKKRENFLMNRLKYRQFILQREVAHKHNYFMN